MTFLKNVTAKSISAQNVDLKGLINSENLTEILNDAVMRDETRDISGTKTFANITIHFLETRKKSGNSDGDVKIVRLPNIDVLHNVSVENIHFNGTLNDMSNDEFLNVLDEEVDEVVVDGDMQLGNVTVFGSVYVESERIGHFSLDDFVNNTIKRDEPFEFDTVEFGKKVQ